MQFSLRNLLYYDIVLISILALFQLSIFSLEAEPVCHFAHPGLRGTLLHWLLCCEQYQIT